LTDVLWCYNENHRFLTNTHPTFGAMEYYQQSLELHKQLEGKIETTIKVDITSKEDLSLLYSPGVAQPCIEIAQHPEDVYKYTIKGNTIAIVSDGSAILGLGNLGAAASIPVMEGKAMLFKKYGGVNAFPICLDTQDTEEIIETVKRIAPVFGGINLEDISAPRCFEIEERLQDLGIPVFHDDQHGTAIVVLAGLINASKVVGKNLCDLKVVINGAGAAGIAIAKMLKCIGMDEGDPCTAVKEVIVCDTKGTIHNSRKDLNSLKRAILSFTNPDNVIGTVKDAIQGADVFIGVSAPGILQAADIETMAKDAIIFACANPTPEIAPEEAYKGGAAIVGTGRSDLPNQVNNVLAFPGIFKGALQSRASCITKAMKLAAANAIAGCIDNPTAEEILPSTLDMSVAEKVAEAVSQAWKERLLEPAL
jgi:malate dehydrogenase (oxaloacetate-decarboxylating)